MREESSINARGQECSKEGRVTPRGERSRESKGSPGSGVVAERGRGERRDRGGSDRRENDESGKAARWDESCSARKILFLKIPAWKRENPEGRANTYPTYAAFLPL